MTQHKGAKLPHKTFLVILLGLLNTITPFSIDMYLPAFPDMATEFNVPISTVALTVSTYFLGFSFGQILYGPLLDRFGRKPPLYIGLLLYILASVGCIFSSSINALLVLRFVQALSGCVASVAAMAMVRDFFPANQSASIISLLVLILGLSPLLAPSVGSLVIVASNWHWVFGILAVITFIILLLVFFFLPEGHQPDTSISLLPGPIIKSFITIVKEKQFYVFSFAGSFAFCGLFVYVSSSPAIFMDTFHVSKKMYGAIFALLSVGFIGGSQMNHVLSRKFSSRQVFTNTLIVQFFLGLIFFTGVFYNWYGIGMTICFLFVLLFCAGLTYPNAAALALAPFKKNAGTASALLGFIQIGIGALVSAGAGLLLLPGSLPTAICMAFSSTTALAVLLLCKAGKMKLVENDEGVINQTIH
jgi:DHA1 family bicyclomycin/chloramphenicol resistance-like MFS transporter